MKFAVLQLFLIFRITSCWEIYPGNIESRLPHKSRIFEFERILPPGFLPPGGLYGMEDILSHLPIAKSPWSLEPEELADAVKRSLRTQKMLQNGKDFDSRTKDEVRKYSEFLSNANTVMYQFNA